MIKSPLQLKCFEFKMRLQGGNSKPFLFAALDDNGKEFDVVVKLRNPDSTGNHFGATSLACELICSVILSLTNLDTPDCAIVSIDESLALSLPVENERNLLLQNKGKNFGTIFHRGATTWFPNDQKIISEYEADFLEDVITFDSTVINGDRRSDKTNILQIGKHKLLIDHSIALPVYNGNNSSIDCSFIIPKSYITDHCGYNPLSSKITNKLNTFEFTKLLSKWKISISNEQWEQIRSFIPPSWEENPGEIDKIFEFLKGRENYFEQISKSLRSIIQ